MDGLTAEQRRLVVGQFYNRYKSLGKRYSVLHFVKMGLKSQTIYNIIRRVENGETLKQRSGQGRPVVKMTKKRINDLKRRVDGKVGVSQRKLAQKFKVTHGWISVILKRNGIHYFKRQTKPKVTEKQLIKQKKCLLKMSKKDFRPNNGIKIIMDDESYFPLSGHNIAGNDGFYTSDRLNCESDVKFKDKNKFPPKIMVWICISEFGHSVPYFARVHGTVDSNIYANECIRKRLVPFLEKHHSDGQYIFWPDGATVHYSKTSINAFNEYGVKFLKLNENPPNIPQLRPIERFWAHLKTKVYANAWEAQNLSQLENRIRRKIKEFSPKYFNDLMKDCKGLVRKAADKGPDFMFK